MYIWKRHSQQYTIFTNYHIYSNISYQKQSYHESCFVICIVSLRKCIVLALSNMHCQSNRYFSGVIKACWCHMHLCHLYLVDVTYAHMYQCHLMVHIASVLAFKVLLVTHTCYYLACVTCSTDEFLFSHMPYRCYYKLLSVAPCYF